MFSFNFFVRIRIPGKSLALVMLRNTRRRRQLSGAASGSVQRGDVRRRKRGVLPRRATAVLYSSGGARM